MIPKILIQGSVKDVMKTFEELKKQHGNIKIVDLIKLYNSNGVLILR